MPARVLQLLRSRAFLLALGAAAIYWVSALATHHGATPDTAYFNQLADAFLHGRVHLTNPAATHDLTQFHGRWYVPLPPLPALLMMPYVALLSLGRLNTVLFATGLGGCNVSMMNSLLHRLDRHAIAPVSASARRWLVVAYALGSIHWYMATQGTVWFLGQVSAAVFVLAAMNFAVARHATLAGGSLGVACLGRPTVLLMMPVVIGLYLARTRSDGVTTRMRDIGARVLGPAATIAALLLVYNRMRFGRFTEFGYATENVAPQLADDLVRFGQFNVHFIRHNVWSMLLAGPRWVAEKASFEPDPDGMSMLLTTPALVYALRASRKIALTWWSWAAVALMTIPLLAYYNTGWWQFGYRFSLDFLPALFVLMAIAVGTRPTWQFRALVLFGVGVNLWGLTWFN
jgi:hypothetical protein